MARNRMISPEFFLDEDLAELSAHARLLYIGTWQLCDDRNATLPYRSKWLKAQVFPYENVKIESLIEELIKAEKLLPFTFENDKYLYIKNFTKHQRVEKPSRERYPEYSATSRVVVGEDSGSPLDEVKRSKEKRKEPPIVPLTSKNSLTPCTDQELAYVADDLKAPLDQVKLVHQQILESIADGTFQSKRYGHTVYFTLRKWISMRIADGKIVTSSQRSIKEAYPLYKPTNESIGNTQATS